MVENTVHERDTSQMSKSQQVSATELKARAVHSAMKEQGRVRDLKTRETLARNLGRIIARNKKELNLSDLVLNAGISANPDPNRLGRYRIVPEREASKTTIERLNQNPLSYYNIVEEIARAVGGNANDLLLELIIGTRFEGQELANVAIEPFEQLLFVIEKKIEALDAKFDLTGYFNSLHQHEILPLWGSGPTVLGRHIPHHSYGKSNCIGWEPVDSLTYEIYKQSAMPCVPLCRYQDGGMGFFDITYTKDERSYEDSFLVYRRVYLAIGKYNKGVWIEGIEESDPKPRPYLITISEFQPAEDATYFYEHALDPITGGLYRNPFDPNDRSIVCDSGADIKFTEAKGYSLADLNLFAIENDEILNLNEIRRVFGRLGGGIQTSGDDALRAAREGLTLSPKHTIAAMLETNLLGDPYEDDGNHGQVRKNVLDLLEEDTERMTSSFRGWHQKAEESLNQRHAELLNTLNTEIERYRHDETQLHKRHATKK